MSASGAQSSPSRNAPCPCGSGKKFKRCCGQGTGPGILQSGPPPQLQQVIKHYQQGNLPAAGQLAENLLKSHPDDTGLIEITAAIALQTGNTALAAERFALQTKLQPGNALAHSNLCMALHTLGRDEEAFLSGQQATQLDPTLADAWNNLGNVYKSGNQLEGALEHYKKALAIEPGDPEILVNAGAVSHLLGDLETAAQHFREATQISPGFASAHNNLGVVLQRQEHYDAAEQAFHTALEIQPDNPEFLTNLANLLLDQRGQESAVPYLEKVMAANPHYIGAWVSMGNLYDRLNDQENARRYFDKALLLDPENSTVLCNIGYRLYETGDQKEAVDFFVRALKRNPNSAKALAGLGKAMLREDNNDKAAEYIDKAVSLAPWDPHSHIAKALLHGSRNEHDSAESEWKFVIEHHPEMPDGYIGLASHFAAIEDYDNARATFGAAEEHNAVNVCLYNSWSQMEEHRHHLDEAERLAKCAVELDQAFPGLTILHASLARRRKDYVSALELLERIDKDAILNKQLQSSYLFELGNVQDKLGNYREAFAAYREANDTKNHFVGRTYKAKEDKAKFQHYKTVFNKSNWQQLANLADTCKAAKPQPVFIVGFPRSGTSLLEQILGSHREFTPCGELPYLDMAAKSETRRLLGSKRHYPDVIADPDHPLDADTIQTLRDFYLSSAIAKTDGIDKDTHWITDKMPHNAGHVGMIRLLFPEAPIIHISRHPLNPCLSAYFSNFKSTHRYTSSLAATAQHYNNVMDILDHYRCIGIEFLEIHYEDLVNDQETVTRQVLDYIGAPWDDACLEHHKSKRVVKTASYEQVTQKIYTSSLNRYQNYWEAVQDVIPILQPTIERFGYTVDPPPDNQSAEI